MLVVLLPYGEYGATGLFILAALAYGALQFQRLLRRRAALLPKHSPAAVSLSRRNSVWQTHTPTEDEHARRRGGGCMCFDVLVDCLGCSTSPYATLRRALRNIGRCKQLWLSDLDDEHAALIAAALRPGVARSLRVLRLGSEMTDASGVALAAALSYGGAPVLEELHLSGNYLGDETALALARAIRRGGMPLLRDLRINHNDIGDEGATAIAEALESGFSPRLTELWLGGNLIGDAGAAALARALGPGSRAGETLSTLALYSNPIGDDGAEALADSVEERHRARQHARASFSAPPESPWSSVVAAEQEGLGSAAPPVTVFLFGHQIQDELVAQRILDVPGMEVYSTAETQARSQPPSPLPSAQPSPARVPPSGYDRTRAEARPPYPQPAFAVPAEPPSPVRVPPVCRGRSWIDAHHPPAQSASPPGADVGFWQGGVPSGRGTSMY